jgi:alpha-galactosidase
MLTGRIDLEDWTLALGGDIGAPCALLWLGSRLADGIDPGNLPRQALPPPHGNRPDLPAPLGFWTVSGRGCLASPSLSLLDAANGLEAGLGLEAIRSEPEALVLILGNLALHLEVRFAPRGKTLEITATITNRTQGPLRLSHAASLAMPLPPWASTAYPLSGRWADEWHVSKLPLIADTTHSKCSQEGRPGFSGAQFAVLGEADLTETAGQAIALTLLWPGAACQAIERASDGQGQVQIGAAFRPGEVTLAPSEAYILPSVLMTCSVNGRNGVRAAFHDAIRMRLPDHTVPRPVHFNTWEAAYFNVSEPALMPLIARAAALGVERFVLDDGWFEGRTSDQTSLGDWTADRTRFPGGLKPVAEAVQRAGMAFGLWVEPEMISPASALYTAHPDWALTFSDGSAPTQRHQRVLDLTRSAVRDHIVARIDDLLKSAPISYLKWDHNRPLFPDPGQAQAKGFLEIVDRVRARHPDVDLELCASGGGRVDLSLFSRFSRLWPTDATNPLDRARVQENLSLFVPPHIMGGHVGASPNPIGGGHSPMAFRVAAAFFSHFGVEADPTHLASEDFEILKAGIALWKLHRNLIARGRHRVEDGPSGTLVETIAELDESALLARVLCLSGEGRSYGLAGLAQNSLWRVSPLWPPARACERDAASLVKACPGLVTTGPLTCGLVHLARIG